MRTLVPLAGEEQSHPAQSGVRSGHAAGSRSGLPRAVLNEEEAERVMIQPDLRDPLGVRDRAILETFYSTGIRRMELVHLKLYNVDHLRGTLSIWLGKGKKDRVVPIGERALAWVDKYLREARPQLVMEPDDGTLFLSIEGGPFHLDRMSKLVRDYVEQANLGKSGACHMLRHTMATLMLEGGADIRFIQEMLGHSELQSTQIYTQVSIRQLKKIHSATHPGATLEKKKPASTNTVTRRRRITASESPGRARRGSARRIRIDRTWGRQATEGSFCRVERGKAGHVSSPGRVG